MSRTCILDSSEMNLKMRSISGFSKIASQFLRLSIPDIIKYLKSIMKYQKSMLKIYEFLLNNLDRAIIIEEIIKRNNIGRTSAYKAIKWMEKNGLIYINTKGKQREVSLKRDLYSLQFKSFLDAVKFKTLNEEVKLIVSLFVNEIKEAITIVLFGSVLTENFNDIDLLIVYKNEEDKNKIINIRNKIESLSNYVINTHFDKNPDINKLLNGICIYGYNSYLNLLLKENKIKTQFNEAVEWYYSAFNNIKNKKLFNEAIDKIILNLSFVYCMLNNIDIKIKEDAIKIFLKEYKINKDIKNMKKVLIEIGKKVFR